MWFGITPRSASTRMPGKVMAPICGEPMIWRQLERIRTARSISKVVVATTVDPLFGLHVPTECPNVPSDVLIPRNTWADKAAYDAQSKKVATLLRDNFKKYEGQASAEVRAGGPKLG